MKKQGIIIFFFLLLIVNIIGYETGNSLLQYISKPLLMPVLMIYLLAVSSTGTGLRKWALAALFFSWAGDVLLMFQERSSDYFLFGLSAFLLAHVFYIVFFSGIKSREGIKWKPVLFIPVIIYYAILIILLNPSLAAADMQMPVIIYGLVISLMLVLALHMLYSRNKEAGKLMATGAALFVLSDSLLAVNKFYHPFSYAGTAVMLTYGLAQYQLISGVYVYFPKIKHSKSSRQG